MNRINARGPTEYGLLTVEITGGKTVERIKCSKPELVPVIRRAIDNGYGWMANGYHPEAGTMLQAYAYLTNIFRYQDVTARGEIGTIPAPRDDVIY